MRGVQKISGEILPTQEYPGFEFIAPVSTTPLTYEVQLCGEPNMTVYESFDVNVSYFMIKLQQFGMLLVYLVSEHAIKEVSICYC